MTDETTLVEKRACPDCGSEDNLAIYSDGHGFCFTPDCGHKPADTIGTDTTTTKAPKTTGKAEGEVTLPDDLVWNNAPLYAQRGLTKETQRFWAYLYSPSRKNWYAVYRDPETKAIVGAKTRGRNKTFSVIGKVSDMLFGRDLWQSGGKKVVVTEGEIDAMTVSQLQNHKWPVVSLPNGAQSVKKAFAANLKWLCSFEQVILMFDQDEAGRKAVQEAIKVLPAGKAYVASLPLKDPNECLVARRGDEVINAIWRAEPVRPGGLITLGEISDRVVKPPEMGLPWFLDSLTEVTYGRRYGELYMFGAGTGVGKTDFITQQIVYDRIKLGHNVGVIFLEQSPTETGLRLAGKADGKLYHIPGAEFDPDKVRDTVSKLDGGGKLTLYDHFGACDWDSVEDVIRFVHAASETKIFYVDHMTAFAAGAEDERKTIEAVMAKMGSLVKELDIMLHVVSHLSTPEGKPHEEGGRVMIRHFKGSRTIGYWSHFIFGLERNQQAGEVLSHVTTLRGLKDRYTGRSVGAQIRITYDQATGLLSEAAPDVEWGGDADDMPI